MTCCMGMGQGSVLLADNTSVWKGIVWRAGVGGVASSVKGDHRAARLSASHRRPSPPRGHRRLRLISGGAGVPAATWTPRPPHRVQPYLQRGCSCLTLRISSWRAPSLEHLAQSLCRQAAHAGLHIAAHAGLRKFWSGSLHAAWKTLALFRARQSPIRPRHQIRRRSGGHSASPGRWRSGAACAACQSSRIATRSAVRKFRRCFEGGREYNTMGAGRPGGRGV